MIVFVLHVYDHALVVLRGGDEKFRIPESLMHTVFDISALVDIPGYNLAVPGAC